jgi:hypothetical protein
MNEFIELVVRLYFSNIPVQEAITIAFNTMSTKELDKLCLDLRENEYLKKIG